eukprot:SAG31_NODE_17_length_35773_cov_25.999271_28_plen_39_part_00
MRYQLTAGGAAEATVTIVSHGYTATPAPGSPPEGASAV